MSPNLRTPQPYFITLSLRYESSSSSMRVISSVLLCNFVALTGLCVVVAKNIQFSMSAHLLESRVESIENLIFGHHANQFQQSQSNMKQRWISSSYQDYPGFLGLTFIRLDDLNSRIDNLTSQVPNLKICLDLGSKN